MQYSKSITCQLTNNSTFSKANKIKTTDMKKLILLMIFIQFKAFLPAENLDSMLIVLDSYIAKSDYYIGIKEKNINKNMDNLKAYPKDNYQQLKYCAALFDDYKSYKYDSAYVYAIKTLEISNALNDSEKIIEAKLRLVFCYLSSGLFKESFDLVNGINYISDYKPSVKLNYFKIMSRLYFDMADYNSVQPFRNQYIEAGIMYSDSAISLLPKNSIEQLSVLGLKKMKKMDYNAAIADYMEVMKKTTDFHEYAIAASSLGYINTLTNQYDEAAINIIKAAIGDIQSSTKETVALRLLATQLYLKKHDINRAYLYIKIALDDAVFYNARHRKIEIGSILPIIEKERIAAIEHQRNLLIWLVSSVSLLLILLLVATLVIYKQLKKIKIARQTIENQNEKLIGVNVDLKEANSIKDKYLGHFFYVNYQFIDKIERIYRMVNRKLVLKQYDELAKSFKESDLQHERNNMYKSFDETFLRLFPDFVYEYKRLFPPEEWESIGIDNESLTLEMRIFALIRLGVYESEKISKFLNYSVNTINTYKTKVKNKSIIPNEQFEKKIMEIKYHKSDI
jgi:hypothetical protein